MPESQPRLHRTAHVGAPSDNRVIHGDNLLALRLLHATLAQQVRCIYIDPPYNTGNTLPHYADNLQHATWLVQMRERLHALHAILRDDGFLCCHIDDSEGPYLKVLLDEVFGRSNFLATLHVRVRYAGKTLKQDMDFHREIEYVHVYRKSPRAKPHKSPTQTDLSKFCHSVHTTGEAARQLHLGGKRVDVFVPGTFTVRRDTGSHPGLKQIWASGSILDGNSSGRFFRDHLTGRAEQDGLGVLYRVHGIGDDGLPYRYFTGPQRANATQGKYFQGMPCSKVLTAPIAGFHDLAAAFGNCRHEGGVAFRSGKKPEALLRLMVEHFSAPGDWVLDAFAGSGTTGAVAHKMGRRWILIEHGAHCHTHVVTRLRSVVAGHDATGISEAMAWRGGGGFGVFCVASSLEQVG